MNIITLTLNPAFDVHCECERFETGRETLADSVLRGIGGKGINISRALLENGTDCTSLVVLGCENADDFLRGMDACGLSARITLTLPGRIRENITIHPASGAETRLSFRGFSADASLLDRAASLIRPDKNTLVTFTGSLPAGVPEESAEVFLQTLEKSGARVVIDSKSVPFAMLRRLKPWLIKPNAEEIAQYLGGERTTDELCEIARRLHTDGIANAMISLGADGAILACEEGVYLAKPPKIDARSTIGAGDSMIAGFLSAMDQPAEKRLRTAIAYGSAACLTEGTNPPKPADIAAILEAVQVDKIQ